MTTTTVNHINVALAAEVAQEIADISAALTASAEKPSAKVFRTGIEMDEYVKTIKGINIMTRHKMLRAFDADNAGSILRGILDKTPAHHFRPEVKEVLNDFWDANFKR